MFCASGTTSVRAKERAVSRVSCATGSSSSAVKAPLASITREPIPRICESLVPSRMRRAVSGSCRRSRTPWSSANSSGCRSTANHAFETASALNAKASSSETGSGLPASARSHAYDSTSSAARASVVSWAMRSACTWCSSIKRPLSVRRNAEATALSATADASSLSRRAASSVSVAVCSVVIWRPRSHRCIRHAAQNSEWKRVLHVVSSCGRAFSCSPAPNTWPARLSAASS